MSRQFYCSQCGKHLTTFRKALPTYGTVIDLIDPHECSEEPIEFDLTPLHPSSFKPENVDNKFVQKLNELTPKLNQPKEGKLRDRRNDVPSSAPPNVLGILKNMQNSIPDKPLVSPESEE